MTQNEMNQAAGQAHFDAYAAAKLAGKTLGQAMQIADAAAVAKRLALTDMLSTELT